MMEIETVAVLGTDRDAVRAAFLCSLAGLHVRLADASTDALDGAFHALRHAVEQALAAGRIERADRQRVLDGILITADVEEALVGADLAFAATAKEAAAARALLPRLAGSVRATSLLATPLEPEEIAGGVPQPGRVVGLALEPGDDPLPRAALRTGPATTAHARARGEQLVRRLARASSADA
jgi:3-hydroxyacyl-CoA dehydrogenase